MEKGYTKRFISFILKGRVLTLILATLFAVVLFFVAQFIIRSAANDPQIQIAEDTAIMLSGGVPGDIVVNAPIKDIGQTLSPFTVIFNASAMPVIGNASYKNVLPNPPKGIFFYSLNRGQHRVTWQPEPGLRFAVVIVPYHTERGEVGYVMTARSLREAESRIGEIGRYIFSAWFVAFIFIVFTSATGLYHAKRLFSKRFRK